MVKLIKNLRLSPKDIFNTNYLSDDLARRSVRGGAVTVASRGVMVSLNLLRTIILARLLTPQDFGIIAMVSVFIGLANLFKDAGLSMATIQKDVITAGQISTLFWANIVISFVLGGFIVAIAPLISIFYDRHELTAVTIALALSFVIQGVSLQHSALLRRHMRFMTLGIIEILGAIAGLIVAVILALKGWSYWALVYSTIFTSLSIVIFTILFCPWLPGKVQRGHGVRSMLMFGVNVSGYNFAMYLAQHADSVLIGKFVGAEGLGIYNRAYNVIQLPIASIRKPLANVSVSAFAKIQNDTNRIKSYAKKYTFLLAFFVMPLMVFAFIYANEIIYLLLGDKWDAVVPVFQVFAMVGFIQLPLTVTSLLLISCGKSSEYLRIGLFSSFFFVVSFSIGMMWGTFGVAIAYAVSTYILAFPMLWYTAKHTAFNAKDFIEALAIPTVASIMAGLILFILPFNFINNNIFLDTLTAAMLFFILYIVIFAIMPGGIYKMKNELFETLRKIL